MTKDYFGLIEIFAALSWLLVILAVAFFIKSINSEKPHYRYYMRNVYFKLTLGLVYGVYYSMFYYDGGDTVSYFDGAIKLNNLLFDNPSYYFTEMWNTTSPSSYPYRFNASTGIPPISIYRENEAWFICKIFSFFSLITFKSYWGSSFLASFILANVSWKFYDLVVKLKSHSHGYAAFAILFIPSVSFWCATVSKDMISITATFYIIVSLFKIFLRGEKMSLWNWITFFISVYLIAQIRTVYLMALFAPILFVFTSKIRQRLTSYQGFASTINYLLLIVFFTGTFFLMSTQGNAFQSYIDEAAIINQDFTHNETYGSKKYDLGITDFSAFGMIKAFPFAVVAGIYRPYIWEALSVTLILNGIESIILIYLTWRFFRTKKFRKKINQIRKNELMMYLFYYAILMAFMAGFTGVLFGVLVRFKAAVLPFVATLLTFEMGLNDAQADENKQPSINEQLPPN
ncbi:MAG: hypothetical protein V4638_03755 [Bacteroidota bacterium]